jgi:hypothetical protein
MALSVAMLSDADGPFSDIRELTEAAEALLPHTVRADERRSVVARRPVA